MKTYTFRTAFVCFSALCTLSSPAHSEGEKNAVKLEDFVVSAAPFKRNQVDLAQSTTVLSPDALSLRMASSLGDTLQFEPGISSSSFGPGASRPIIRGLGGDRIRVLQDSIGTLDASIISPDHAVSIDPLLAERVEIVRGPASLLYGSAAVGGVVNVITHRIDLEAKERDQQGLAALRFGGAGEEISRALNTDLTLWRREGSSVILHLDGLKRESANLSIPGYALSAAKRQEEIDEAKEHGEEEPVFQQGSLGNSRITTEEASAGLSFVTPKFAFGVGKSGHNSFYGVPGHSHEHEETEHEASVPSGQEGVYIQLKQRRWDYQGELRNLEGFLTGLRFKGASTRYEHQEIEDGSLGTRFDNRGSEARLEGLHGKAGSLFEGAMGLQYQRSDFSAEGDEAFLPPSLTKNLALFLFEETKTGDLRWQFGARTEKQRIEVASFDTKRDETLLSGSLGVVWSLNAEYNLALSVSRSERGPNAQELYADGAHAGTQSYEIGDPSLGRERSHGIELSLRRRLGRITGEATIFVNNFNNYIHEQPTGEQAFEGTGGWEVRTPATGETGGMPVYRYVGSDATFHGLELEALVHLHEGKTHQLDLRLGADYVRARSNGEELPRTPPARGTLGLVWNHGPWTAGADLQYVLRQKHIAAFETETAAYTLLGAHVGYLLSTGRFETQLLLAGTNLLDREARMHTSFLKDLAPLGGRAFSISVRFGF